MPRWWPFGRKHNRVSKHEAIVRIVRSYEDYLSDGFIHYAYQAWDHDDPELLKYRDSPPLFKGHGPDNSKVVGVVLGSLADEILTELEQ